MKKLRITLLFKIIILLFLCLYIFYCFYNKNSLSKYKGNETSFIGIINSINTENNKVTLIIKAKENLLVNYYLKDNQKFDGFKIGDKVIIQGNLVKPNVNRNFHLFNYQNYLLSKKIYYIVKCNKITKLKNNTKFYYNIKQKLIDKIDNIKNNEYLKALIIGDKTSIDDTINSSYQNNGISHLLAISGMHITILTSIILKLLKKINKKEIINEIVVMFLLIFYSFIVSFSVSVIRASLMFIISRLFKIFKKNIKPIEVFLITLTITLFINPFYLYSVSFQYSFTVSFFLILFSDLINKQKHYISKIFMTSLIAFLVSIPIQINNFFSVNFLSVFLNIIFVPIFTFVIFPFSIITFIFPFLINIFCVLTTIFENISIIFSNFKIFTFNFAYINMYGYIYYYLIIILCLFKLKKKKYLFFSLLIVSLLVHYNINYFKFYSEITMLDVRQGDSLLISLKHNEGNILIDTGGIINYNGKSSYSISENTIIPYLKSVGIKKLDYLILTHGDYDHMGESIDLINNFKVNKVILNSDEFNELEQELIKVLNKKKIKYYNNLKEININNNKLVFLNTNIYDNENDNSNVIYFKLNKYSFLFMGDAGITKEKDILDIYNIPNIDFLKVGHHGSNTSSSKYFIDSIKPTNCLISVGQNNRYGHPKQSVLDTLSDCNIYRTDNDGSIKIRVRKNSYKIKTFIP